MEAVLARAFALVGKGCKRPLNQSVHAFTSPGRRSHMREQLRHLHRMAAQAENSSEEHHQQLNNSGGAPSRLDYISEQNWSMRRNYGTMESSADAAVDSFRDTAQRSFDERFATLKSIGEDRVNDDELKLLLKKKPAPLCYVWCDPSPWMHISEGIMKTIYVNKMVKSGYKVKILMADWFARMDREIGGNLNKMRTIGLYNIEMWKATGMALDEVEIVWLSDEINRRADKYWPLFMDIARKNTLNRLTRSCRSRDPMEAFDPMEELDLLEELTADEIFYPCMQCASILFQKVDICLLSMDFHDATLLARQYRSRIKRDNKPIAVLHNMLPNLLQYPEREDWKHPGRAIFMEDDTESICRKTEYAFCPPKLAEGNPCLGYVKYVIFPWFGKLEVVRKKENGGNKTFLSVDELTADYVSGAVHPSDLKLALARSLNEILQPVRDHFGSSTEAKGAVKAIKEYYIAK